VAVAERLVMSIIQKTEAATKKSQVIILQVGFPTSVLQVHSVMTDEVSSMVSHMRKLMGSDHPVLRTLKRLIFHEGKNNLQVYCEKNFPFI